MPLFPLFLVNLDLMKITYLVDKLNRDYHRNIKTLNVGLNGAGFELKYIDIITYSS
jgi:hypothetical protein